MPAVMENVGLHAVGAGVKADRPIDLDIDRREAIDTRKTFKLVGDPPKDTAAKPDAPQPAGTMREMVTTAIGGLITAFVVGGAGLLWSWLALSTDGLP
jgi:hypothetical protein